MSAAEPANPPPGPEPHSQAASVIHLSMHPAAQQRHRAERATAADREPSPEQQLAEHVQGLFSKHGRTLTDKATAETYGITLGVVLAALDGALAQGLVGQEQHRQLRAIYEGMQGVPRLL